MKFLKIILSIIVLVTLTNYVFIFRAITGMIFSKPDHHVDYFTYITIHGEYKISEEPLKGPQFQDITKIAFKNYKNCHPTSPDTLLYRTFKKNIWEFWNWGHFFTDDRYKIPYLNPDEIIPLKYKVQSICN